MARDDERVARSREQPIVGSLPDAPGIRAAIGLTPALGTHMLGLADVLLVDDYPGATIGRAEREMLAEAVSAGNDCFFCMDSHGAHAGAILEKGGATELLPLLDAIKVGDFDRFSPKMRSLIKIARTVGRAPRELTAEDVAAAQAEGATDGDVQLAVLIASAFCMYNRMVDGFRARTSADLDVYRPRAAQIAELGYSARPAVAAGAKQG
jgi:AhpD family alkylhydroperoxidase